MRKLLIPFVFVLCCLLFSCSSVKKDDSNSRNENITLLDINNDYIKNLEFDADFYIKSSFGEFNLTGEVRIEEDQKLNIDFYGPFGIQLARLYSDTSNFIAHNLFENTIYTGSPTEENIFKATGMYLSVRHLIKIMRSELLFKNDEYLVDESFTQGSLFKRVDQRKFADFVLVKDKSSIQEYQRKGANNETLFRVIMENYQNDENFNLAKSVNITIQDKNFNFKYLAKSFKVNSDAMQPNTIKIPNDAKIINLNNLE